MNSTLLRRRWSTRDGKERQLRVIRWLLGVGDIPDGLTQHDGRVDLRGIQLPAPTLVAQEASDSSRFQLMGGLFHFKHQQWSSLDLSYARLAHLRFSAASISNCVFEDAGCRDWRLWDSQIESSSFARADLRDAAIATWYEAKTNDWRGVRFDGADLRGGVAIGGSFVDSSFRGAKLDGVEFQQSHIERCTFDGLMRDVIFDGRDLPDKPRPTPLRRVDFSGAVFEDVAFRGCSFDDVRMPDIPGIRVIRRYPVIARRVLALAEATTSVEGRMLASELRNALKRPGADDSIAVLNRRDYLAAGGESFADFAEALFMEAENLAG